MRACFSGACFVAAYPAETQQAFLEGHVAAFDWFGGVFAMVRYDNLGSAVKQVLRGRRRVETDRFVALRSHYLFDSAFTRRARRARMRRAASRAKSAGSVATIWSRCPRSPSWRSSTSCSRCRLRGIWRRTIRGRQVTVGQALGRERLLLRSCRPSRSTRASTRARGWTARRWRRCVRTSTRCRSRWPGCGSPRGSVRGRSSSA